MGKKAAWMIEQAVVFGLFPPGDSRTISNAQAPRMADTPLHTRECSLSSCGLTHCSHTLSVRFPARHYVQLGIPVAFLKPLVQGLMRIFLSVGVIFRPFCVA